MFWHHIGIRPEIRLGISTLTTYLFPWCVSYLVDGSGSVQLSTSSSLFPIYLVFGWGFGEKLDGAGAVSLRLFIFLFSCVYIRIIYLYTISICILSYGRCLCRMCRIPRLWYGIEGKNNEIVVPFVLYFAYSNKYIYFIFLFRFLSISYVMDICWSMSCLYNF